MRKREESRKGERAEGEVCGVKRPRIDIHYKQGCPIFICKSLELRLCLLKSSAEPMVSSFALGDGLVEIEAGVAYLLVSYGL